ncbi:MAG: hypothetical protein Q8Q41_01480 [bacterium]|nr:hypothetical protein [bacterium]
MLTIMDSFGKNVLARLHSRYCLRLNVPLLALLLVGVIGLGMRYAPESATVALPLPEVRSPLVVPFPVVPTPAQGLGSGPNLPAVSLSNPLERAAEFGIETILPPTGLGFSNPPPAATPNRQPFTRQRQEPALVLSDYEIFAILHPPYYLQYLSTLEDLMIRDGRMRADEKLAFNTENKVISFLRDKVFDYIVLKGITVPEDRARFERGLEVVQELHRDEANYLRYGAQSSKYQIVAFWQPLYDRIKDEKSFAEILAGVFFSRARAQAECFQIGAGNPAQGTNLVAVCCDCNISGYPVGCLNAVCPGRPAIYDQTTGICGCDT